MEKTKIHAPHSFDLELDVKMEYRAESDNPHQDALEWCKICIQKTINEVCLSQFVNWDELIAKTTPQGDEWFVMECRLPIKVTII